MGIFTEQSYTFVVHRPNNKSKNRIIQNNTSSQINDFNKLHGKKIIVAINLRVQ